MNYAKCPRLSVSRIFLDFNFFCVYYLDFFAKKHIFSSRIQMLLIQVFIIILSCKLCPVTLHLSRISMFHSLLNIFKFFIYFVWENNFWLFCEKHGFLRIKSYYEVHDDVTQGIFLNQIITLYHNFFRYPGISSDCEAWLFSDKVLLVAPSLTLAILTAMNLHTAWRFIHATHLLPVQERDSHQNLSCQFQELMICCDYITKMILSLNKCRSST